MKKKKVKYWLHLKIISSIKTKIKCAISSLVKLQVKPILNNPDNNGTFFFVSHKPALDLATISTVTLLPFILNAYRSSHAEVFLGKSFLKYAANLQENTHAEV